MAQQKDPFERILYEIEHAVDHGYAFLALSMAVALPDICQSLISVDGRTTPDRYRQWCSANLGQDFSFVTPDDLYSMRCGVLHNGRFGDLKHSVERVVFALPGNATLINCRVNEAYVYSSVEFVKNFTAAARKWFSANANDGNLQTNLPRMLQYHPQGLSPYITGMGVLA
jgi:hypothetical protein